jgi:hypothetical protein
MRGLAYRHVSELAIGPLIGEFVVGMSKKLQIRVNSTVHRR